jgi:hypothetical protein
MARELLGHRHRSVHRTSLQHVCSLQKVLDILVLKKDDAILQMLHFDAQEIAKDSKIFDRKVTPELLKKTVSCTCSRAHNNYVVDIHQDVNGD